MTITGDGFKDSNTVIRFSYSKDSFIEVNGTFVSTTEMVCETPSFDKVDKPATVTLSISKGDYTITSTNFQYYLNTQADQCIAFGPGLFMDNCAGVMTTFIIQARNTKGSNRQSGADEFVVKFCTPEEQQYLKLKATEEGEVEEKTFPEIPYTLVDNDSGQYNVKYKLENEMENLQISIFYKNQNGELLPIRGSPFKATHKFGVPPKNNEITGPSMI